MSSYGTNADINQYINPGIFTAVVIFFTMVVAFLIGLHQLMALQTPSFYPEKSPHWGKVEENE